MMPQATLQPIRASDQFVRAQRFGRRQQPDAKRDRERHDQPEQDLAEALLRIEIAVKAADHERLLAARPEPCVSDSVNQAFQPSGRFWASNSL